MQASQRRCKGPASSPHTCWLRRAAFPLPGAGATGGCGNKEPLSNSPSSTQSNSTLLIPRQTPLLSRPQIPLEGSAEGSRDAPQPHHRRRCRYAARSHGEYPRFLQRMPEGGGRLRRRNPSKDPDAPGTARSPPGSPALPAARGGRSPGGGGGGAAARFRDAAGEHLPPPGE